MWPFKRKSADHALQELVDGLSRTLNDKLLSVLLYGSKVSGEYRENRSDVNVFILIANASRETIDLLGGPIRSWTRAGHRMPVFVPKSELQIYAENLPIEFLDMQDHHRVIFGSDPLQELKVDNVNLRAQCAQELALKQLKLRQAVLLAAGNAKRLRKVLMDSLSSVLTLYRAGLRLEKEIPKESKIEAAVEFSKRAGFDDEYLERLWEIHLRRQNDNIEDLAVLYLAGIERALAYVSKK